MHPAMKGRLRDWKDFPYLQSNSLCEPLQRGGWIPLRCMNKEFSADNEHLLTEAPPDRFKFIKASGGLLYRFLIHIPIDIKPILVPVAHHYCHNSSIPPSSTERRMESLCSDLYRDRP